MQVTNEMQGLDCAFIIPELVQVLPQGLYAEDSFARVAGRIMQHLYECMKTSMQPQEQVIGPEALGINKGYWFRTLEFMQEAGMIRGIETIRGARILSEPVYTGSMAQVRIGSVAAVQAIETQMTQAKLFEKVNVDWSDLDFNFGE